MTLPYSTDSIAQQIQQLELPFPDFLAKSLAAFLTARKATLQQIANLIPGDADHEAKRQQLRRMLDNPQLSHDTWAKAIEKLLPKGPWRIAIDRTEWKWGNTTINLFVLAALYGNLAVPLLWLPMPEEGASDTKERIDLLRRFLRLFGTGRIRFLCADREFIGEAWVGWLLKNKVPFRIRIKACEYLTRPDGVKQRGSQWFALATCACKKRPWRLWGLSVYVGSLRLRSGELLIVISNERGTPLEDYRLRWKIESMFQAFKGRGFDMESSRVLDPVRLSAFFGFLSFALVWCLRVGIWLCRVEPRDPKKHGRDAQSVFRRGLDLLQQLLAPLCGRRCSCCFAQVVGLLSPESLR